MESSEKYNPLDLGKLEPNSKGLSDCMTWEIEPVKILAETIYDLDQLSSQAFEEENKNRRVYLCRFMMERIYQAESFLWNLCNKLIEEEKKTRATIYTADNIEAVLTTGHPSSRCGLLVLLINGKPYRPDSILPSGITAKFLVQRFLEDQDPGVGSWGKRTHEAVEMAEVYLRTAEMFRSEA